VSFRLDSVCQLKELANLNVYFVCAICQWHVSTYDTSTEDYADLCNQLLLHSTACTFFNIQVIHVLK